LAQAILAQVIDTQAVRPLDVRLAPAAAMPCSQWVADMGDRVQVPDPKGGAEPVWGEVVGRAGNGSNKKAGWQYSIKTESGERIECFGREVLSIEHAPGSLADSTHPGALAIIDGGNGTTTYSPGLGALIGVWDSPPGDGHADSSGKVVVWDVEAGTRLREMDCGAGVTKLAGAPGLLITGDAQGKTAVWDDNGAKLFENSFPVTRDGTQYNLPVECLMYAEGPDAVIFSRRWEVDSVFAWSPRTGAVLWEVQGTNLAQRLHYAAEVNAVLAAPFDHGKDDIVAYNASTGEKINQMKDVGDGIKCLIYAAGVRAVITGSCSSQVEVYEWSTGAKIRTEKFNTEVMALAFVPKFELLITGLKDGTVNVLEYGSFQKVQEFQVLNQVMVMSLTYVEEKGAVVTQDDDNFWAVWPLTLPPSQGVLGT